MNRLSCTWVRRRASAFHDGELPVEEQIAVETHLRTCSACATEAREIEDVGEWVRMGSAAILGRADASLVHVQSDIVNRLRVEREESVPAVVSRAFEDMRMGFVAVGSTLATFVSILLMFGMLYFGPGTGRPDSLAALMETLGAQSVSAETEILMPRAAGSGSVSDSVFNEGDAMLALSAVVTRGGRIQNLEAVLSEQSTAADREQVLRLLDQVSRARFEPARLGGSAVAVKTILVYTSTSVRGKLPLTPKQSFVSRQAVVLS